MSSSGRDSVLSWSALENPRTSEQLTIPLPHHAAFPTHQAVADTAQSLRAVIVGYSDHLLQEAPSKGPITAG